MEYKILKDLDLKRALDLRKEVFVIEQNVPLELEIDEKDELDTTIHIGIFEDGNLIAVGRILDFGSEKLHIGRIAVKFCKRNSGVGRFLMESIEEVILSFGLKNIICELDSQVQVVGFYEKLGYCVLDEKNFLDAGIEHKTMFKVIK